MDAMLTSGRHSSHVQLILLVACTMLLAGCPSVGSFKIERTSGERTVEGDQIQGTLGNISLENNPFQFSINLEQELEKRDAKGAKAVFLHNLTFKATESDDNFDFLESVTIHANADNQKKRQIAIKDPVPEGKQSFSFDVDDDVNLKPYVKQGMKLQTDVEGHKPKEDRSFKAKITLLVETL